MKAPYRGEAPMYLGRTDTGPFGYDFIGYDSVFLLNLTGEDLLDPMLGVVENGEDDSFLQALLQGGYANDPQFDGGGAFTLGALPGFGVYQILVPEDGTIFNFGSNGTVTSDIELEKNQVVSLGSDIVVDAGDPPPTALIPEPGLSPSSPPASPLPRARCRPSTAPTTSRR